MKEIKLKGLDETIYYDCCDNGLPIYVWVNKKVNTFKGTITFLVGSDDVEFSIQKEKKSVPHGTAHYLEHILCKNDKGETILGEFQKLGSYSNAATFPYKTVYEFVGTDRLYENISLLLEMTQQKTFVKEFFESERGPILEEARMYQDRASRVISKEINQGLFSKYPNRFSGIGTTMDIQSIQLEDLELLYNSFYHPENSFVTITGNVDPLEVIHFIKENQSNKVFSSYKKPCLKNYREPKKVSMDYKEIQVNIEVPKVYISAKIPKNIFSEYDILSVLNSIQFILNSNFGVTSLLRDELIEKKLVLNLGASAFLERDYLIIQVFAKTKYPKEVLDILKHQLTHLELLKADIERKKKSEISNLVLGYEDPEEVNDFITYQISKFGKLFENEKEVLERLSFTKIKEIFSLVSMKNISVIVALPKEKKAS